MSRLSDISNVGAALCSPCTGLAGLELFDAASTWLRLLPQIVRSYAVEALDEPADQQKPLDSAPRVLLDVLADANGCSFTTCGDGFDVRVKGRSVTGAALLFCARIISIKLNDRTAITHNRRPLTRAETLPSGALPLAGDSPCI